MCFSLYLQIWLYKKFLGSVELYSMLLTMPVRLQNLQNHDIRGFSNDMMFGRCVYVATKRCFQLLGEQLMVSLHFHYISQVALHGLAPSPLFKNLLNHTPGARTWKHT